MKYTLYFLVMIVSLFVACNNEKNIENNIVTPKKPSDTKTTILGSWRLSDITEIGSTDNADPLLREAQFKKMVQEGLIFSFYPDGIFTSITGNGKYEFGKWNFVNNKKAVYLVSDSFKDTFSIKSSNQNDQELLFMVPSIKDIKKTFSKPAGIEAGGNLESDPYYPSNNTWRIKPAKPESPQQIQDRLGNYIKQIAYILKDASDKKLPSITFEFSQGIVKIYNGGVGIASMEEVPLAWIKTYYSNEQALVAYKMFKSYLKNSKSYKGASTGEWFKDDYNIITSMYGDLKDGKFPLTVE